MVAERQGVTRLSGNGLWAASQPIMSTVAIEGSILLCEIRNAARKAAKEN
jgi:hypothetical protein